MRGGLPGQPGRVTRLGGVSFLHVNAEGGVPRLIVVMFIRAFVFSLNIKKPHPSAQGLLILLLKARFFYYVKAGYLAYPGSPASM